jgi:hypothetical protein
VLVTVGCQSVGYQTSAAAVIKMIAFVCYYMAKDIKFVSMFRKIFFRVDAEVLQRRESDVLKVKLKALRPIRTAERELCNYFIRNFTPAAL